MTVLKRCLREAKMFLRMTPAIAALALCAGCPGSLTGDELVKFEDGVLKGDVDVLDDATVAPACDVPTLLKATCTDAGCHGAASTTGDLDLESPGYAGRLIDKASSSASCGGEKLIDPAAPEKSLMYTQLAARPACGLTMPLGKPPLDAAQQACVLAWIKAGAPNGADLGSDAGTDAPTTPSPDPDPTDASTPPVDVAVGTELNRQGWLATASRTGNQVDVSSAEAALDNDLTTRWGTGLPQDGMTDWFQVDMTAAKRLSSIELRMGMWDQDHPRNYKVYTSNDPNNWGTAVASGTTPDQKQPVVTITFPVQNARYLRIENTGIDTDNWWSIYELVVKR